MSGTSDATAATIDFTYTPNTLVPMVSVELSSSAAGAATQAQLPLLIGQTLIAQPATPITVFSPAQAQQYFGRGSMLARAAAAYLANDSSGQVLCLPLPDASAGVVASGSFTIAGPATAAGVLPLYIAGQVVSVTVSSGDTATIIAANSVTAISALPDLPVTATSTGGVITLTAKWKGLTGNAIDLRVAYGGVLNGEVVPAGVSVGIVTMSGGLLDPDLTGVAAAIGDTPYDFIFCPYTGSASTTQMSLLMSQSTGRWSPTRKIWGIVWEVTPGTASALLAVTPINDPHQTQVAAEPCPTPPWELGPAIMGTCAGPIRLDPARPLGGLQVQGVLAPAVADRNGYAEQQALLSAGHATLYYDAAGNVYIQRVVTTYVANAYGAPDSAYLDVPVLYTLMAINRAIVNGLTAAFPRYKLVVNGTRVGPGQAAVSPSGIQAELAAIYDALETQGLVQDADAMIAGTVAQINATNPGRCDVLFDPEIVYGLYNIAVLNQFTYATPISIAGSGLTSSGSSGSSGGSSNAVTITAPSTATAGTAISLTGTVSPSGDVITVALSTSGTVVPSSGWSAATVAGSSWSASVTPSTAGTIYAWARDASTNTNAVSPAITVAAAPAVTISAASTATVGTPLALSGTVIPSGDVVSVALTTSATVVPSTGLTSATVGGTSWTASVTPTAAGTYYAWAVDTIAGTHAVTGAITVSASSSAAWTWLLDPGGATYTPGQTNIGVSATLMPGNASASVQFGWSTSATVPPTSWTAGTYVNTEGTGATLYAAYMTAPATAGTYYGWVETTDGVTTLVSSALTVS